MWVYQEAQEPKALPVMTGNAPAGEISEPDKEKEQTVPLAAVSTEAAAPPKKENVLKAPVRQKHEPFHRDCILLAAAYLFGTFLAGIAAARFSTEEAETFQYYLTCWQRMFSVGSAAEAVNLFRTEFLTLTGALTALLFLGLSALGPLVIFLFTILYGIGSGLLSLQWASGQEALPMLRMVIVCGLPTALAAGALCLFGTSALRVSGRLCASTFGRSGQASGAGNLLTQFVRLIFLALPFCGGAVGLLYLAGQGKLV